MKYIYKKRLKLVLSILAIPFVIFLISVFVHSLFLVPYVKNELELKSKWFREILYEEIQEEGIQKHTDSEIKLLWNLSNTNNIRNIKMKELLDYIRIFYIGCMVFIWLITAVIVKWYCSNTDGILISDEPLEPEMVKKILNIIKTKK